MLMDPHAGDVLLASFSGPTIEYIEGQAGKYLRELGRKADGRPTISSVIVRNDGEHPPGHPLSGLDDLGSLGNASEYGDAGTEVIKIMVELEHES